MSLNVLKNIILERSPSCKSRINFNLTVLMKSSKNVFQNFAAMILLY